MKLIKPIQDFDYSSESGGLQYRRVQGTLEQQRNAFTQGGFSWVSASELRKLIADNPKEGFGINWHRVGDGAEYTHTDKVHLYMYPISRILLLGQQEIEKRTHDRTFEKAMGEIRKTGSYSLSEQSVAYLPKAATETRSGIFVVELDALTKNKAFVTNNKSYGHAVLSTTDYALQMSDDPNLANLVKPGFGTDQETLDKTMHDLKANGINETKAFVLMPEYIRTNAPEGTGLGRLSAVNLYYNNGFFDASLDVIDLSNAFAFGVRQAAAGGSAEKKQ